MCLVARDEKSIVSLLDSVKDLPLKAIPVDLRLVLIQVMCLTGELEHVEKVLQYYRETLEPQPGTSDEKTCTLISIFQSGNIETVQKLAAKCPTTIGVYPSGAITVQHLRERDQFTSAFDKIKADMASKNDISEEEKSKIESLYTSQISRFTSTRFKSYFS